MAGIALLGAGIFATERHLPSLKRVGGNLKAVWSRSESSATKLLVAAEDLDYRIDLYSEETPGRGLDALLARDDVAAVIVALPIPVQPDICRRALAAGKHVLCEKPVAPDVASARELIREYRREWAPRGLVFSIAEQFRYLTALELARRWLVEDRVVGELSQVHFRLWRNMQPGGNKYQHTAWRKEPEFQGGFVLDGGVHHVAMLRYVTGQEIVETRGFARQLAAHMPPCDTVHAALLFSGGAVGTFSMSFVSSREAYEALFVGTENSLSVSSFEGKLTLTDASQKVIKEEVSQSNGVDREIEAFIAAVAAGKNEDRAGLIEAFNDVAVVESLLSEGGKVQLWEE